MCPRAKPWAFQSQIGGDILEGASTYRKSGTPSRIGAMFGHVWR